MKLLKGILLPALLLASSPFAAAEKDDGPAIEANPFTTQIESILYFDDSAVVLATEYGTGKVYRSENAGKDWEPAKDIATFLIVKNPFDNKVAVALGEEKHWITYNQGESWRTFTLEGPVTIFGAPISFHASDNKKIIINTLETCRGPACIGKSYYTEDGFKTDPMRLRDDRKMCQWARGSVGFLTESDKHKNRILCIVRGKFSEDSDKFRLLMSDDYFKNEEEPLIAGRAVSGMANMASVKGYLVVAAKSERSSELALYVTKDTDVWHRAEFGEGRIEEDAYTILESTNYSIQVDVMTSEYAEVGSLYTSNSNGTYFTKNIDHTNRNKRGYVDFEKIANIQGIVLVNVVDNWKDTSVLARKKLKSKISFDDGRTFESLKVGDKNLHLHSVTNLHNSGRVFSSPAPGIVMGVGNTGEYLGDYTDGDLYVSDDAGLTWKLALQEAHKYEFGDQGSILVAIYDEGETDKIMYSLNHGKDWAKKELPGGKIRARELTTVPDSTSLNFILYGTRRKDGEVGHVLFRIGFDNMHERTCTKDDFETWFVKKDGDEEPSCIMGHKQKFQRRKADANCFIKKEFKDPEPEFQPCDCDEIRDYECDFNFKPEWTEEGKKCIPSRALELPEGACKGSAKTYKGSSGWRKIPGNQCKGSTKKDQEVERDCDEEDKTPKDDKPNSTPQPFKGSRFLGYYYLERGVHSEGDDETVVVLTSEREAWITHDHGKTWKVAVDQEIVAIYPHQYNNDVVYFLTATDKVWYSLDRGRKDSIHSFKTPQMPNTQLLQIMQFHPNTKHKDWIIWLGGQNCGVNDPQCHTVASVSRNNGGSWDTLLPYVKKCAFVWREVGRDVDEKLIFCEQHAKEEMGAPLELIASQDWFETKDVKFKSVVEFATMSEFIIVATKGEDGTSLKLDASLDGKIFADARFPPKFQVDHQTAYTVLDSSTHSVFLHVTVNPRKGQEYGSIIKSNSNGTSYVLSLSGVNRNTAGYVDFEKMQGIEGVALANVVSNIKDVDEGEKKIKKTMITHNDGADWEYLEVQGSPDVKYPCDIRDKDNGCSLHLHGYTERQDPRETYSSPTAVGVALGVGNVGASLGPIGEASTFITTDAGVHWKLVKEGNYAWEFGDQGSVIVIVKRNADTKELLYSLDLGDTWMTYKFNPHAIRVEAITTVPSDTSLNFLIWGKDETGLVAINVDFSNMKSFERQCDLNENDHNSDDYTTWIPEHPLSGDLQCLFGHVAEYHRKKPGKNCYNGNRFEQLHGVARNCTCTRRDYECDYNFERLTGGTCKKIEGLELPDPKDVCKQKGVTEYWDITGYRKIPISTCTGGAEMDRTSSVHPCPGHEPEFKNKHGVSGFGLLMAIVIPFTVAGGIGYYVWRNWDGKFGRIRLGDSSSRFDSGSPWISWPVAAISGLVAVVAAVPLLIGSLWRAVSSRFGGYGGRTYTSRSSFARGRGDYAVVDPDEGELLGDESDEEV